mmetsp:Transcript_8377/g.15298  ORF Transcript_8377/g.15298 Transcript_8377/m.15298 type:complete len:228 (+) Transcript_8377:79-762(+)
MSSSQAQPAFSPSTAMITEMSNMLGNKAAFQQGADATSPGLSRNDLRGSLRSKGDDILMQMGLRAPKGSSKKKQAAKSFKTGKKQDKIAEAVQKAAPFIQRQVQQVLTPGKAKSAEPKLSAPQPKLVPSTRLSEKNTWMEEVDEPPVNQIPMKVNVTTAISPNSKRDFKFDNPSALLTKYALEASIRALLQTAAVEEDYYDACQNMLTTKHGMVTAEEILALAASVH